MSVIIYNGKSFPLDHPCIKHNDRGLTLGHGLFETIFINKGTIPALDYHWQRLETSAPLIGITVPFSKDKFLEMLASLIERNVLQEKIAVARITITHGESERGILPTTNLEPNYIISVNEYTHVTKPYYSILIASTRKNEKSISARVKSISYLDNILAKQEAISQGYDEAILLNTESNVADGAITNIFIVKDNQIYTPPIADGSLPGVVRRILLQQLTSEFSIIEKSISPVELFNADEVFLTNALIGIQQVNKINKQKYETFSVGNIVSIQLKKLWNL